MPTSKLNYVRAELARLNGHEVEGPPGLTIVRFVGKSDGDPQRIIDKIDNLLKIVDQTTLEGWISEEEWSAILPSWFVGAFAPPMTEVERVRHLNWWRQLSDEGKAQYEVEQVWSLDGWLYWMQPENRQWFVLSSASEATNEINVCIQVLDWPFPWGSLRWIFRVAGCSKFEMVS